jgi:hypothetical protein
MVKLTTYLMSIFRPINPTGYCRLKRVFFTANSIEPYWYASETLSS